MTVGAAVVATVLTALIAFEEVLGYRLVAADPEVLPSDATLMAYGAVRGKMLYRRNCQECHAAGGVGNSRLGVPNLADADWLYGEGRVSEIESIIEHGIRAHAPKTWNLAEMPAYVRHLSSAEEIRVSANDPRSQTLSPSDIRDVVEYLLALEGRQHVPEGAARGQEIYAGRGACYDCHASDARGDSAIGAPNLTDNIWLYGDGSRTDLIDTLEHGRRGACPAWGRELSAEAIRELAVYVYTLSHGRSPRS